MTDKERAVTLSLRELGSVMALANANEAVQVAIREQRIDASDAFSLMRDGRVRTYVVTLYGAAEPYSDQSGYKPNPEPLQFLLISGPAIDGTVDVVALSRRQSSAVA